jgi:hypothetical protein
MSVSEIRGSLGNRQGRSRIALALMRATALKIIAEKTYPRCSRQAYIPHVRFG